MSRTDETIVAAASAVGGAARGIVRISGPGAVDCVARFFAPNRLETWPPRTPQAVDGHAALEGFGKPVPAMALVWPGARSYTREPCVELHLPGSTPIVEAAAAAACQYGARPARPGEFTLRAFLAGRIDLTQAEAVLGVVEAGDERRLREALKQLAGGLSAPLDDVRNRLLDLTAHLEAGLDFVEEDIEFVTRPELLRQLAEARQVVASTLGRLRGRSTSVDVVRVVLCGRPNVGKSSLFNALVEQDRALVSPQAGTTRDYLAARLELGGVVCELIDTAGQETARTATVADAAQTQTRERRDAADVQVWCFDDDYLLRETAAASTADASDIPRLFVRTKVDLGARPCATAISISVNTGLGMERLRAALGAKAAEVAGSGDVVTSTALRCRDGLERTAAALAAAGVQAREHADELVAALLREALDELGQVVGAIYTDDILDRIFSRFCIGK